MYILTRKNRVIDYCEEGYLYLGNIVFCESKSCNFEDATIVDIGNNKLPSDIDSIAYDYIHGKFVKHKGAISREEVEAMINEAIIGAIGGSY